MTKKILLFIMIVTLACTSLSATGMPVIDISSITESITQFVTTVQQYNRQIQQWKSEWERLERAAKQISSGDYQSVISGLASITGQISRWNVGSTAQDVFRNFHGGVLNFDNFYKKYSSYSSDISAIWDRANSIIQNRYNGNNGFSVIYNAIGSGATMSNAVSQTTSTTARIPLAALRTYENWQNVLGALDLLEKDNPTEEMEKSIKALQEEKDKLQRDQKTALDDGNTTLAQQKELLLQSVKEQIDELNAAISKYEENIAHLKTQAENLEEQYNKEMAEQSHEVAVYNATQDKLQDLNEMFNQEDTTSYTYGNPNTTRRTYQ